MSWGLKPNWRVSDPVRLPSSYRQSRTFEERERVLRGMLLGLKCLECKREPVWRRLVSEGIPFCSRHRSRCMTRFRSKWLDEDPEVWHSYERNVNELNIFLRKMTEECTEWMLRYEQRPEEDVDRLRDELELAESETERQEIRNAIVEAMYEAAHQPPFEVAYRDLYEVWIKPFEGK